MNTHLQPTRKFLLGFFTKSYVSFFSRACISSWTAFFHFGSFKATCIVLRISTPTRLVARVWREGDKWSYETKFDITCWVQVLTIRNLGLLCSHALDLIGCMHLSLRLSRPNTTEKKKNWFQKPLKNKDLEKKMLIPRFECSLINSLQWITCIERLENFSSCYYSRTRPIWFPCTMLMHITYKSYGHDLCTSRAILEHATYMIPKCFSTPKIFCLMTLDYV